MKGQIHTEYYTVWEGWRGIGYFFFFKLKGNLTKCYKGTYPHKDHTNAQLIWSFKESSIL